jgi:hypothetical protein
MLPADISLNNVTMPMRRGRNEPRLQGGHHSAEIAQDSRRGRGVWRKQLTHGAVEPPAELFEHIQPDILLAHFKAMEGSFRNPELPRELPVGRVPASPADSLC